MSLCLDVCYQLTYMEYSHQAIEPLVPDSRKEVLAIKSSYRNVQSWHSSTYFRMKKEKFTVRRKLSHLRLTRRWSKTIALSLLILTATFAVAFVSPLSASANTQQQQIIQGAQVSINAGTPVGNIPGTAFGLNTAAWDSHLLDGSVPGLLQQTGVKLLRFPGGSTSDYYQWQSNTTLPCSICGTVNANDTFDAFMGVAGATGAQAMITINYGSGTPQAAAGWVQYANKGGPGYSGPVPTYVGGSSTGHTYGIKYWEIGNELYGNGTYGATWEYDQHSLGPAALERYCTAYCLLLHRLRSCSLVSAGTYWRIRRGPAERAAERRKHQRQLYAEHSQHGLHAA